MKRKLPLLLWLYNIFCIGIGGFFLAFTSMFGHQEPNRFVPTGLADFAKIIIQTFGLLGTLTYFGGFGILLIGNITLLIKKPISKRIIILGLWLCLAYGICIAILASIINICFAYFNSSGAIQGFGFSIIGVAIFLTLTVPLLLKGIKEMNI